MKLEATFAANLKRHREAARLTQTELGDACDVTWQTISNYETMERQPRNLSIVAKMAKAMGIRPWQLLAEEGEGGSIPPELIEHVAAAARICGLKGVR